MLFLQNFTGERHFCIAVANGNNRLQDDRAGVEIFVDEMDGAAGEFHAVFERLALRFEAGNEGSNDGWILRMRSGFGDKNGESRRMYPARQIRSTWCSSRTAATWRS